MNRKKKNILITGAPGSGKTVLIMKLSMIFKEFNPAGFYTTEIVENGNKTGFEVVSLYGDSRTLAHVNFKSKCTVGRYKVDVKGFEDFITGMLSKEKKTNLYIFDEIGKMECGSKKFSKLIIDLLNSPKPVIATIADRGTGLISEIKKRDDVVIYELTENNRDLKLKELTMKIRDLLLE